jgi:hypothetical protein
MEETRREFTKVISKQYEDYCKSKEVEPTTEGFATYLVNRTMVNDLTIRRFLVVDRYPIVLSENMNIKQCAIWQLEEEVNASFSTIRTILDRFQSFFRVKSRVKCNS